MSDRSTPPLRGPALGALLCAAALLAGPAPGAAQEATDSLRAELAELRAQIDSLRSVVSELQAAGQEEEAEEAGDALERLRRAAAEAAGGEEAEGREQEQEQEQEFQGRQRSMQALNPEISVNSDVFGRLDTDDADRDNFIPREAEFSFQASLDPYSRAKFFVAHHVEGTGYEVFEGGGGGDVHGGEGGGGFAIEEGYVEWVGIPGGISVKLGRFFQQFGTLNRWHNHALAFQTRSLPHLAFLGEESLAQSGASFHWLIPAELGGTYETTFQITRSSNPLLFGESDEPSFLGHVNAFWQLGRAWDLDLGVSAMTGDHVEAGEAFGQNVYNIEGALTWRPPARALYRELSLRGGAMFLDPQQPPEEVGQEFAASAWGAWTWLNLKFARQWHVGGRFEWTQNPADRDQTAWLAGPTLTWWQSEWVRLRAEYDYLQREGDRILSQLLLQVTFAMGPHKHETY